MWVLLLTDCAGCFHSKENHKPVEGSDGKFHICTGSLECRCEHYEEPYLVEFAQDVEKQKLTCKTLKRRCEYILVNIPQMRNAGEKSFAKVYKEIWYGFSDFNTGSIKKKLKPNCASSIGNDSIITPSTLPPASVPKYISLPFSLLN